MSEEPPAYRIMGWRYLPPKPRKLTFQQAQEQHMQLSGELGQTARAMPDALKGHLAWAMEQAEKLNGGRIPESKPATFR